MTTYEWFMFGVAVGMLATPLVLRQRRGTGPAERLPFNVNPRPAYPKPPAPSNPPRAPS